MKRQGNVRNVMILAQNVLQRKIALNVFYQKPNYLMALVFARNRINI